MEYPQKVRLAVIAEFIRGKSVKYLSHKYGPENSTISRWTRPYRIHTPQGRYRIANRKGKNHHKPGLVYCPICDWPLRWWKGSMSFNEYPWGPSENDTSVHATCEQLEIEKLEAGALLYDTEMVRANA